MRPKYTLPLLSVAGSTAAQGVTVQISPSGTAPAGCEPTYSSNFEIAVVDVTEATISRRANTIKGRAANSCSIDGILIASLAEGVLKDSNGRTGYIASNYQFQFDEPPQAGAIYTAGFTVCRNNTLALGPFTIFYKCQSGGFYNLYDRWWAAQCSPVEIEVLPCGSSAAASQSPDGQVVGTEVITTTIVKPLSDGQPQVITTTIPIPMCQINDGQAQVKTTPCESITSSVAPVSQYSDGQIQVTTAIATATNSIFTMPSAMLPTITRSASTVTLPLSSSSSPAILSAPPTSGAELAAAGSLGVLAMGIVGAVLFL